METNNIDSLSLYMIELNRVKTEIQKHINNNMNQQQIKELLDNEEMEINESLYLKQLLEGNQEVEKELTGFELNTTMNHKI